MIHGVTAFKCFGAFLHHSKLLRTLPPALLAGVLTGNAARAQMPPPTLVPEKIAMGAFYDGARIHIEGTAPMQSDVLIVIRGTDKDEIFNRKGRVGPIWLNVDRIHIKQAPSVFLSFSSADAGSLLDRATLNQYQLDEAAIMHRIHFFCHCKCSITGRSEHSTFLDTEPDRAYVKLLYADFLKLKEDEGSYGVHSHAVTITSAGNQTTKYDLDFAWPKMAPPGDYQVEVYACRGRQLVARSEATLQLVEVGFPAYIARIASVHPWGYGVGAVLVAMLAGFLTDAFTTRIRRRRRRLPEEGETPTPEMHNPSPGITSAEICKTEATHHG